MADNEITDANFLPDLPYEMSGDQLFFSKESCQIQRCPSIKVIMTLFFGINHCQSTIPKN